MQFWTAYPKKVGKKAAFKAWQKAKDRPPLPDILDAIKAQTHSKQWTKDNGEYIPHPATWINAGRWDDEQRKPHTPKHYTAEEAYA